MYVKHPDCPSVGHYWKSFHWNAFGDRNSCVDRTPVHEFCGSPIFKRVTETWLMPQSHHTPGPRTSCSLPGLFWTNIVRPLTGPVRILPPPPPPRPYGARRVLMHALLAYGPRTGFEIVNSPWGARTGPVRPNTTPVWDFCQLWLCQFPYVSVRAPYGYRRIWKTLNIPVRGPCGHRTYPWTPANYSTKP